MINMSSKDATSLLGTYLLQGWIMTDIICSKDNCGVPLMRSKDGLIQFCVTHDTLPTSMNSKPGSTSNINTLSTTNINERFNSSTNEVRTNEFLEVNTTASVTTTNDNKNMDDFRLKEERREQSSLASQLIGQKMLQRWVLLNETCPNDDCYAIPLIRHPTDKTMYCVICEKTYQHEKDADTVQQQRSLAVEITQEKKLPIETTNNNDILAQKPTTVSDVHTPLSTPPSDRSIKRQKTTETDLPNNTSTASTTTAANTTSADTTASTATVATTSTTATSGTTSPAPTKINTPQPSCAASTLPPKVKHFMEEGREANEYAIRCLSKKIRKMMDEIEVCTDHYNLIKIVQAVEACSKGINTCKETLEKM
ncbi:unnamed protein product [Cunninghamella echinulata]